MSADDTPTDPTDEDEAGDATEIEPADVREELDRQRTRGRRTRDGVEEFDQGIVDLLSWALDTDTRARIYIQLRRRPHSTSEEVAEGTGLYPSTVREALADLHTEAVVERRKRTNEGAGNNPYEYTAIAPSELVGNVVGQVQAELNALFNLDRLLGSQEREQVTTDPVTITVEDAVDDDGSDGDDTGDIDVDEE